MLKNPNQPLQSKKADLRAAYLATDYRFEADTQSFTLRIGEQHPYVCDLLKMHNVKGAAFITAYNPFSLVVSDEKNTLAMGELRRELEYDKNIGTYFIFEGAGQDCKGDWPPEQSLMVLGISRSRAEELGRQYGQNAIVWVDGTGTPSLVELESLD